MHRVVYLHAAVALACLGACERTVEEEPVGGATDSEAEVQRFVRRAYLDLSGRPPSESDLAATTTRLRDAGNTAAARESLIGELIATEAFASLWIDELENGLFGGNTLDGNYAFVCAIVRGGDRSCDTCTETDSCNCNCAALPVLKAERTDLRTTRADMQANMATSSIERRYAMAVGYFALAGEPEARVRVLFDDFLARPAELDEMENGRAMIVGALFPGSPAGLMFHRHGSNYADLVDIVFESEVYREALVRRMMNRYLAREPNVVELAHFVGTLDAMTPDARGLVRAIVSSREYFDQ